MDISGWNYNFEHLPYWDQRKIDPYAYDALYENKQLDIAVLIYSICEIRMCYYVGFLAIFKNKQKPELIMNITGWTFKDSPIVFSADGKFAFIHFDWWSDGWPILIFDFINYTFSYFYANTEGLNFTINELKKNEFSVVHSIVGLSETSSEVKIELEKLEWMHFRDIDSFSANLRKR